MSRQVTLAGQAPAGQGAGRRAVTDAYYAGRSAGWRGEPLDDVPAYYTDEQADAWERGWYSAMDDECVGEDDRD